MSVIVKGVRVPKNCYTRSKYRWSPLCPCWRGDAKASYYQTSRHPDCPIVEVEFNDEQFNTTMNMMSKR